MKKEDLTTRLVRNFFHIQGPFDECRQEVIYKACARSIVQIFYSSFFLFLFYLLFASLLIFIIVSGNLPIYDIVLLPVFVPALNKGLTYLKIDSQKTRILNLALFFMILSFLSLPQLTVISNDWKYYLLLTIAILSSITYLYYLYQFVKETK